MINLFLKNSLISNRKLILHLIRYINKIKYKGNKRIYGIIAGCECMNSLKKTHYRKGRKPKTIRQIAARERFYKSSFYFFEIGFIVVAIPVLILALTSIPVMMYFAITQYFQLWPFVLLGVLIAGFQIYAIQFFVKKFILKPLQLTFGEYLRMRFDERYKKEETSSIIEQKIWYDNLDEFIIRLKTEQKEQTLLIYTRNHPHFQMPHNNWP